MLILIDGEPFEQSDATISVLDWGVIRGFGVFEVVRSYAGIPFRLDAHLDRLARSASALWIDLPERELMAGWIRLCAESGGDCQVRLVATGGGRGDGSPAGSTIVVAEALPEIPAQLSVLPLRAPWHPATDEGGYAGVKWTSYAPNMAATDTARRAGYDDALLLGPDDVVLEGTTYTVAWLVVVGSRRRHSISESSTRSLETCWSNRRGASGSRCRRVRSLSNGCSAPTRHSACRRRNR